MNNQVLLIVMAVVIVLLLILTLIIVKTQKRNNSMYDLDFEVDKLVTALGGKENIEHVEAIGSRLKVNLIDNSKVNYEQVKALGATAIIEKSDSFNFIFGKASTSIKALLEEAIK